MRRTSLAALLAIAGCRSIFGLDDPAKAVDAGDQPVACMTDQECMTSSPQHPHCDPTAHVCVECITNTDCTSPDESLCSPAQECVGCIKPADCSSNVCLRSGSCAAETAVIYVDEMGTDTGTCPMTSPCKTIAHGLMLVTATRKTIKLHGGFTEIVTIQTDVDVFGDASTAITSANDPTIRIQGAIVGIYDFAVVCTNANAAGVQVEQSATVKASGLAVAGCGPGLDLRNSFTVVTRSLIVGNPGGGIRGDSQANFAITDCIVVRNGGSNSSVGGASFAVTIAGLNRFEHNTVADNTIKSGTSTKAGVNCALTNAMVAPNNLVAHNNDSSNLESNVAGCDFASSHLAPDVAGLAFINPFQAPYDYHLGTQSSVIDKVQGPSATSVDFDGDLRPYGAAADFGADEYRP